MKQQRYVGLNVSLEGTLIYVIYNSETVLWRGKCNTEPPQRVEQKRRLREET